LKSLTYIIVAFYNSFHIINCKRNIYLVLPSQYLPASKGCSLKSQERLYFLLLLSLGVGCSSSQGQNFSRRGGKGLSCPQAESGMV